MASRQMMLVVLVPILAGCSFNGDGSPQVLGPQAFYDQRPPVPVEDRRQGIDAAGAIVHNPAYLDEPGPVPPPPVTRIAPGVAQAADASMAEPATAVIVGGSTTMPSGTNAQYLTAGAVVVRVGDTPIYADKVIRVLTPVLSQAAKDLDIRAYQLKAQKEITDQVRSMISNELYYSTAIQNLTAQEIQLARGLTAAWRVRQITEAGGSQELARAKARAEGIDFEEKVNDQYRLNVWKVYLQKKIYPLVSVRAQDMRDYYTLHISDYTENEQVQFRVIKITAEATGGREQAIDKIGGVRQRMLTASAAEFAKEAAAVNDDRGLKQSGGRIGSNDGWLSRGSFAAGMKDVENAVWALQPGQMTEVIELNNAFYIARMEDRKPGRVRSFDDQQVQEEIDRKLRQPQIDARQKQLEQRLIKEAVISPAQPTLVPVFEMAMQKYGDWHAAK